MAIRDVHSQSDTQGNTEICLIDVLITQLPRAMVEVNYIFFHDKCYYQFLPLITIHILLVKDI